MIYITGDMHANINPDMEKYLQENLNKDDILLQLGDFGYYWNISIINNYPDFPFKTIAVLGNHENYSLFETFKDVNIFGARCKKIKKNVYVVKNGEILNIENKKFFVFGGALSIDKAYRLPYISWWPQEQPNIADFNNAVENLSRNNYNIDYFLAHDVDRDIASKMFHKPSIINSSTSDMLRELEFKIKENNGKAYEYFFGHWHAYGKFSYYTCLYEQIYCIETGDTKFFPRIYNYGE